jgi:(p)ppGpp synthase/HD superfamily hydrolase
MKKDPIESARERAFMKKIRHKFKAPEIELLMKAYAFLKRTGAGPESSPFKTAELILEHGADAPSVAAVLLVQALWDGRTKIDEIRKEFGGAVATNLGDFRFPFVLRTDTELHRRTDIHALLGALAKTPRKALLLIAFRLIEVQNAFNFNQANSRRLAQETIDFYVPITNLLSLGGLRRRLEDACFHILEPAEYEALRHRVAPIQAEDDKCLEILTKGVRRLLNKNGLTAEIQGRTKSLHAIRRKMIRTGKSLNEIMDRVGIRIIVASVPECYSVLGLLHTHFKPIPGTFDDYIGLPKDNGYQSLHTCVYPMREISHKPIEFQVRTKLMHKEAEHGAAAHWLYKNQMQPMKKDPSKKQRIQGLLHQHRHATSPDAFLELLHRQVYADHLVVFGKGGRISRLPDMATVHDYLNRFNIDVGPATLVRVNGKVVDTDRPLRDGDSIEIVQNTKLLRHKPAVGSLRNTAD